MKKSKAVIKTILVLPLVLGLLFSSVSSLIFASQTGTLVATVRINPLEVEVTAPSSVSLGERFKVEATVKNSGDTKIKKTKIEIFLNSELNLDSGLNLKGNTERKRGVVLAKDSKTAFWWVTAEKTGIYVISVEASGIEEETGDLVEASGSTIVEVEVEAQASTSFWSLIRQFLARA